MSRTRIVTLTLALALCTPACRNLDGLRPPLPAGRQNALPPTPVEPAPAQDPISSILRYEAARSDGQGFLQFQLARGDEAARVRAATALGRMPFPEQGASVSRALESGLDDIRPRVRAATAFALGLRADPATAAALAERLAGAEPEVEVRARLVEAASRIDAPSLWSAVIGALSDEHAAVREEAALGIARWKTDTQDAPAADAALLATAGPGTAAGKDPELRWRVLFALARRKCAAARGVFVEALADRDPRARTYAAQGLAAIPLDDAALAAITGALGDHDARVVCELLRALGEHPLPAALEPLLRLAGHPSAHVRRCLFEALGHFRDYRTAQEREQAVAALEQARNDPSVNVRAAAIVAGAKLLGDAAAAGLEQRRADKDPNLRLAAAAGFAELSDALAVPALVALSRDPDLRVAGAAIEGLAKHLGDASRARLHEVLEGGDNGLALAAVESLRNAPLESDLDSMEACWKRASGDISSELKAGLSRNAAKISGERAAKFAALKEAPRRRTHVGELEHYDANPRVEVATTRGTMVFELFPEETPLHVHNFLELARRGYYEGTLFHRVVPDFVIQGGDYRGDGNGGKTWDGDLLPGEFTPRKFVRGSLGMPRNEDPDSGGSQIFVTHRETPHLDGRYTLFGQLLSGEDVLDAIEVGDRILSVRVQPGRGSR
ncbi:MAG: peptidylprolyl isomerase [Planctomycetes bacterium]|nr:peptidylprolyl isomerase [Planctomycetota bacterium]